MDRRARALSSLLSGSRLSDSQRRRTDVFVMTVLAVGWSSVGLWLPVAPGTPTLAYAATVAGAVPFVAAAVFMPSARTRALTLGFSCAALVLCVLALPITPTHSVGLLSVIFCLITLYDDALAWSLTFVTSAAVTLVLAAEDPALVFGVGHRHQWETPASLLGHLLMFLLAASASGIVWVAVSRARAVEREARMAETAIRRLLPALAGMEAQRLFSLGDLADRASAYAEEVRVRGRHLLDHVEDAVVEVSANGSVQYANPSAGRLWGVRAEELCGRDAGGLLLLPWETLRAAAGDQEPCRTTAVHASGVTVPIQVAVTRLDDGDAPVYVVTALNLTDRLAAQAAAHERLRLETQRRYALELNDTVVQGLTVAVYAHETGAHDDELGTVRSTLVQAREMVSALLDDGESSLDPGQLRRSSPATPRVELAQETPATAPQERQP